MTTISLHQAISQLQQRPMQEQLIAVKQQLSHQHCMLCGQQAVLGLKINFYHDQQHVWAQIKSTQHQQGYSGIAHGGFSAALLDAVMCQSLFAKSIEAVTADMSIRFLKEIPIHSKILLKGTVLNTRKPLYKVQGELFVDSQLMAKSEARFMHTTNKRTT